MGDIEHVFPTSLYRAKLGGGRSKAFLDELLEACLAIAEEDTAGQAWSAEAAYRGYTSYASLNDLPERNPSFAELCTRLAPHLEAFAKALDMDLRGHTMAIDSIWINVLEPGGSHSGHIHPNSVLSGTVYVAIPDGASALRFEDPRLALMMAAPPRRSKAMRHNKSFIHVAPKPGLVLLWESWLRHEVMPNQSQEDRVSISFNAVVA